MPSSRWKTYSKIQMHSVQLKTNIIRESTAVEGLIQCLSSSKWNSVAALSRPQPSCPSALTRPQRRLLANVVLWLAGHDPPSLTHPPHDRHARDRWPRRQLYPQLQAANGSQTNADAATLVPAPRGVAARLAPCHVILDASRDMIQ